MSHYRKRKSSEVIESDRKRFSADRYGYSSYRREYNEYHSRNEGHTNHSHQSSSTHTHLKNDYGSSRHFNIKSEHQRVPVRNIISPVNDYNSSRYLDNAIVRSEHEQYDSHRQFNFKYETYVQKLKFCEARRIDYNGLWKYLTDIRCDSYDNFSTAYDVARELETSLKFYIDTRNEMIFLQKVHRLLYVPFSYNEINISNTTVFYNRINFLENESMYRSHRMNQLYQYLQGIVIPSVLDDIRFSHSLSNEAFWTDRGRYWFNKFKLVKWEKNIRWCNDNTSNYLNNYERPQTRYHGSKRYTTSKESDFNHSDNIKSEAVAFSNVVPPPAGDYFEDVQVPSMKSMQTTGQRECDQVPKMESKAATVQLECTETAQIEGSIQQETNTIEKLINIDDANKREECDQASSIEVNSNEQNEDGKAAEKGNADKESIDKDGEEAAVLSNSLILVEPEISIISVVDEEDKGQKSALFQ